MTKIIAEIGWNHLGSTNLAKKMILAAKKNGADLVKTQIFDIKYLKPGPWSWF
jgi:sialic acid synthase SpsE